MKTPQEPSQPEAQAQREESLAMMMRMLISSLKKHNPDSSLPGRASALLRHYDLMGSPLREDAARAPAQGGGKG